MLLSMCSACQGFGISTPPTLTRQSRRADTLSADCKFFLERSTSTPGSVAGQCTLLLAPDPVTWQNRAVAKLVNEKEDKGSNATDTNHWLADKAKLKKDQTRKT
ncbi:uncharacterized [Tachysurus ichikawai]